MPRSRRSRGAGAENKGPAPTGGGALRHTLGRRAASPRGFPGPGRLGSALAPRAGSLHSCAVTPERLRNPNHLASAARLARAALLGVLLAAAVSLGATPNGTRPGTGALVIPPGARVLVFAPHPDDETIGA